MTRRCTTVIRDTIKDAEYFNEYLNYQNKRIQLFIDRANSIQDKAKNAALYSNISVFLKDKFYASYSYGVSTLELIPIYLEWLSAVEKSSDVCYSDLIDLASLCVLLEPGESSPNRVEALITKSKEKDDLLDFFSLQLTEQPLKFPINDIKYSEYAELKSTLISADKAQQKDRLHDYINKAWYQSNKNSAWYDSHLSKQNTYVGYWCFIGAAIVKILSLDFKNFSDIKFFPSDIC